MDEYGYRGFAGSSARGELVIQPQGGPHWGVLSLSAAGIIFILLGLLILALPAAQEGALIWELDTMHAIRLMDVAGVFTIGLGTMLTWLSGQLWQRQLRI